MHTDGRLDAEDGVHPGYESSVDRRSEGGDDAYSFAFDGVDGAAPHQRAVRVARHAHPSYADLVRTYDACGYSARVARITQRQLNRAANAIADLTAQLG